MPKKSRSAKATASSRAIKGERLRRKVLGNAHVDASMANIDDFGRALSTFLNEWVWHDVWGRKGLPLKTRSLINMALLTALNRPRELLIHLKGALNNGCTVEEISEVLLHTSLYAGIPATLDGMHTVREALIKSGHLPAPGSTKTKVNRAKRKAK